MDHSQLLELIERSKAGDRQAQEKLVTEAQNRVYFHCKKMLKNEDDALDATQDVLIAMLTNLDKLREPAAFWGWVNGITANRCKHLLSQGTKEWQMAEDEEGNSLLDDVEDLDEQVVPDKALDNQETSQLVMEIIDSLPAEQKMCVLFFYYDEMTTREISEAIGVPEGTVKSRLNHARRSIKEGVENLAKKGTKLYGISPLPFLAYFLRMGAKSQALSPAAAATLTQKAMASVGTATAVTGAAGATGTAATVGTGASSAGTVAAGATAAIGTSGAGATVTSLLGSKIALGLVGLAVTSMVVAGGVVISNRQAPESPSAPVDTEVMAVVTPTPEPTPGPANISSPPSGSEDIIPSQDVSGDLPGDDQSGTGPTGNGPGTETPDPAETDPFDTSDWTIEDTSSAYQDGDYRNNKVVSFAFNDAGETISFGIENGGNSDRIYLNPTASFVNEKRKVGFYLSSERYGLISSNAWSYAPIDDPQNAGHTSFVINKAYDELTPADGTCLAWANDVLVDGQEDTGTILHGRAVDLTGGCRTIALFTVTIGYHNGAYSIDSIDNADCLATGDLTSEDYYELLYHAYDTMSNPDFSPNIFASHEFVTFGDRGSNVYFSRVEHLGKSTYFNKVYTATGSILKRAEFLSAYSIADIYAVTLNTSLGHTFTMYYAVTPDAKNLYEVFVERQIQSYTNSAGEIDISEDSFIPDTSPVTSKNLVFVGFDLFNPQKRADTGTYFEN